jgi:hypothetical protein
VKEEGVEARRRSVRDDILEGVRGKKRERQRERERERERRVDGWLEL